MIPAFPWKHVLVVGHTAIPLFGICFATGILTGVWFSLVYLAPKYRVERARALEWCAVSGVFAAVGSRLVDWAFYGGPASMQLMVGMSSTGAMAGGLVGCVVFALLTRTPLIPWVGMGFETTAFVWAIGRLGCALNHEHLGGTTVFPLAIRFADGSVRHDLGFYEFLFLAVFVTPYVWRQRRAVADPWRSVVAIGIRYGVFRFLLDFMRFEPRYFGLTFAQYFCLALLLLAAAAMHGRERWRIS